MSKANLVNFIEEKKNYDHISAVRAAYQTRIFLRSLLFMFIIAFLMFLLDLLPECLILFVAYKLYRENAGGVHIHGYIKCFVFSLLSIGLAILLAELVPAKGIPEALLISYSLILWYLYVPQGTSQRPIRKDAEKKRMKLVFLLLILLTFTTRFINYQIYSLVMWAMVFVLTLTTPVVYRLLKVSHDRIPIE